MRKLCQPSALMRQTPAAAAKITNVQTTSLPRALRSSPTHNPQRHKGFYPTRECLSIITEKYNTYLHLHRSSSSSFMELQRLNQVCFLPLLSATPVKNKSVELNSLSSEQTRSFVGFTAEGSVGLTRGWIDISVSE